MTHTIETRDPKDLAPHPILKGIPAPEKDAPAVLACADAIREQSGHLLPLVIDEQGRIMTDDSRLRWMAARRIGMSAVPVVVQPGALAPVIALNAILHRKHYTKSAIAYLAVPLLKPAFEAAREHMLLRMKWTQNPNDPSSALGALAEVRAANSDEMAEKLGICRRLLFTAREVHAEFAKDTKTYEFMIEGGAEDGKAVKQTLREHFEPKILRDLAGDEHEHKRPMGLGGVKKAIGSVRATKGAVRKDRGQLELFDRFIQESVNRMPAYDALLAEDATAVRNGWERFVAAMPASAITDLKAAIRAREQARSRPATP